MKTLITLSTILAAGTLAVNAATTLVWNHESNTNLIAGGATKTISITGVSNISVGTTLSYDSGLTLKDTGTETVILGVSSTAIMWSNKFGGYNSYTISSTNVASALSKGTGLTLGTAAEKGVSGGAGDSTLTLSFSNLQAEKTYAFTLIFRQPNGEDGDNIGHTKISLTAGELVTDRNNVKGTDGAGSLSETEFANYNYTADLTNGSEIESITDLSTVYYNDNTTEHHGGLRLLNMLVTTNDAGVATFKVSQKGVVGAIALTTIPEPSAFGLLAGIGALALAGTRRRRKMR